jgi:hypothetical protein
MVVFVLLLCCFWGFCCCLCFCFGVVCFLLGSWGVVVLVVFLGVFVFLFWGLVLVCGVFSELLSNVVGEFMRWGDFFGSYRFLFFVCGSGGLILGVLWD